MDMPNYSNLVEMVREFEVAVNSIVPAGTIPGSVVKVTLEAQ